MSPIDYISILKAYASSKRKRVQPCQLYDSNVSTSIYDQATPWIPRITSGFAFSHDLRMTHRKRRVHIAASPEYISLQLEGRLNAGLCSINRVNRVSFVDVPTDLKVAGDSRWPVFIPRWGSLGATLYEFLDLPALHSAVALIVRSEKDSVHIFEDSICVYFRPDSEAALDSAINSLCEIVGPKARKTKGSFRSLPDHFTPLIPLIEEWAEDDDGWREDMLAGSPASKVEALIETVLPFLNQIDKYLNTHNDEAACALGRLAEVAIEAKLKLGNQKH